MSLGVAIPTYSKHFPFLQSLLENIASSTVKPEAIAVSCSSMPRNERVHVSVQGIPVVIDYSTRTLNPSQNRNRAASFLTTDFISFVDGDDLVHPQRIDYVKDVLIRHPEVGVVYHGYEHAPLANRNLPFPPIPSPDLLLNSVVRKPPGPHNPYNIGILFQRDLAYEPHHAHITVRRRVFDQFKFDESPQFKYSEDSRYAMTLLENTVPMAYLANPLTRYIAGTR
jgi:hypothetical protein